MPQQAEHRDYADLDISRATFAAACLARAEQTSRFTPDLERAERDWAPQLAQLRRDGWTILRDAIPRDLALDIGRRFKARSDAGEGLQLARANAAAGPDVDYRDVGRLTAADMAEGAEVLRARTNIIQADEPLLQFPELLQVGLHEPVLDIAGAYLGCLPIFGYLKVRRSLASALPPFDTEYFHVDGNAAKMVKSFLFLHDADVDDATHELVVASHRDREEDVDPFARFTRQQMVERFGEARLMRVDCRAGDLVLEDTSGFHRAVKPRRMDRAIVIFNYGVQDEYGGGGALVRARAQDLAALSAKQKAAAIQIATAEARA